MIEQYIKLTSLGNRFQLKFYMEDAEGFVDDTEQQYEYVRYNPRKNIARYGLSITSLDGQMSGIPDLDSLLEYNIKNNTNITEKDCNIPTKLYNEPKLKELLNPFAKHLFRTHIIKLDPGGFFPVHRDAWGNPTSFRLAVPLKNCEPPNVYFILDGSITYGWELGRMYFVDTIKEHSLFNASFDPSYWLVLNVALDNESINTVVNNLKVY